MVAWLGLDQTKNKQLIAFPHHENGIAGYKNPHDPVPVVGVYRCLGVFIGVVNTVGWMEGVILIPKRIMFRKGVKVLSPFSGEGDKFLLCVLLTGIG